MFESFAVIRARSSLSIKQFFFRSCYRVMINSTDTDGDGKATVDELTVWTLQSIKSNHDEEASQRLKNMDKNGDRKVSLEEYLQSAQKIEGGQ